MRKVRVFVSSPIDVAAEREGVQRVVERLNGEFADYLTLETVRWETSFYSADAGFQDKIPEAKACDLVIAILWSRLGSPLPATFAQLPSTLAGREGEPYPSGTAYEILSSLHARAERIAGGQPPTPDVYVFRKLEAPKIELGARSDFDAAQEQWDRLDAFFQRWFRTADGRILRAFHSFHRTSEFEAACEDLIRTWIKSNVTGAAQIVWPIAKLGSPFRGLAAFDARHAQVFFGRDRKVARTIELIKKSANEAAAFTSAPEASSSRQRRPKPFLLLVGPSGAGKSSLARAGIIPRLTAPGVVPDVDFWRVAVLRPSEKPTPLGALADALVADGSASRDSGGFGRALPEIGARMGDPAMLETVLGQDDGSGARLVSAALDDAEEAERRARSRDDPGRRMRGRLLLLVDQLEDIFSVGVGPEARKAFAGTLAALAATGRVWILATIRGDLYERLISDHDWLALKDEGCTYDLAPPGPEELDEIVRKSATAAGLHYDTDTRDGTRLDQQLLADASGFDSLPLLQFTLNRLFERRETRGDGIYLTFDAYRQMGGLDGAIDQAAEQALGSLGDEERAELPRLLRLLVVPVEGKQGEHETSGLSLTVRPVDIDDARRNPASQRLVDALIAQRILLASKEAADSSGTVQVAHQRVLASWNRARLILADHREFYRIRDDVEQQYRRWKDGRKKPALLIPPGVAIAEAEKIAANYRDELRPSILNFVRESGRRARWRLRFFQAAAAVLAILALVAAWQRNEARTAQRQATANYETARGTVDRLIGSFADRMSQMEDISIGTIEAAYGEIDKAVEELGVRAAAADQTFDATRGAMALSFANLYKKTETAEVGRGGTSPAVQLVNQAIDLFKRLVTAYPAETKYKVSLARGYALFSDLNRATNLAAAKLAANTALDLITEVANLEPDSREFALERSRTLIRLGDLQKEGKDFKGARAYYEQAIDVGLLPLFERDPDDKDVLRELSWQLAKIGDDDLKGKPGAPANALANFERSLCLRRRLLDRDPANALFQIDVSWSLDRVSQAKSKLGDLDSAEQALLEAITLRRTRYESDQQQGVSDKKDSYILNDLYRIALSAAEFYANKKDFPLAFAYLVEVSETDDKLYKRRAKRRTDPKYDTLLADVTAALAAGDQMKIRANSLTIRRENEYLGALSRKPQTSEDCWPRISAELGEMARARKPAPSPAIDTKP
ncbi:MAG: hypothetical protein NW216_10800 [Hyphomicrobium sp.]|nr:hypothetical protein [Hyphomicrobium sp.]